MMPTIFPDDTARVRESDPISSHEAADSNNVPRSHMIVMRLLEMYGPSAQFEIERWADWVSPSRIRSAFSELEALGKVRRHLETFRRTPSGRRAQLWELSND